MRQCHECSDGRTVPLDSGATARLSSATMTAETPRDLDAAAEAALARLLALLRKAGSAREAAWAISSEAIAALGL